MNALSQQGEMYRKPKIDDEFDTGKNKKNKKNKAYADNNYQNNGNEDDVKPVQKIQDNSQELIKKLQGLFPSIDKDLVADIYRQSNNLKTAEEILKGFVEEKGSPNSQESPIEAPKEQVNEENILLEDDKNYDLLQEHDDLYDQLSVILEDAFERNDIADSDIDDLLNMCEENVCFLIEEEQKFVQNPDEMIQVDQVTKEIQQFILQQIQKEQKSTIVNTSYSNFPSLGASNTNANTKKTQEVSSPSQYATIIQNENKKVAKKIQPQISNKWASESVNNQIHIGTKPGSTREIIKLCKHFPSLSLTLIKTIYTHLDEDFEFSMKYLMMKYKDAYQSAPKEKKKVVRKAPRQQANNAVEINQKVDATVEQILRDYTYEEMRQKVQQLTRIKYILDRTASQARGSRKYSEVSSIENAARDQAYQLDKFSKASKKILLEKARKNKEFYQMDLHGLYWDEAKELVAEQLNYLANIVPGNESQFKYIDKIRNGRHYIEYCVITGKGNNSRNNVPVLHNNLCSYLKEKNIMYDPLRGEGKVAVYIPL